MKKVKSKKKTQKVGGSMETLAKNESYTPPLIFILIAVAIIVGVVVVYQDKLPLPPLVFLLIFVIIVGFVVYRTIRITRRILSTMILAALIGGIFGTIAKDGHIEKNEDGHIEEIEDRHIENSHSHVEPGLGLVAEAHAAAERARMLSRVRSNLKKFMTQKPDANRL